jgi:glycosyltransferase involved in cell wall biosynthesis
MDVLHITHQFAPETRGGIESYLADVVAAQRAGGLDARILTGTHRPAPTVGIEQLALDDLPLLRLYRDDIYFDHHAKAWHPEVERALAALLERERPGLVHVHQWIRLTNNLVELARLRGFPVVVTLHDFYSSCPRAFRMRPGDGACHRPLTPESCRDCVPRYGHEDEREIDEGIALFRDQMRSELELAGALIVAVAATADLIAGTTGVARERFTVLPLGYRPRFARAPLPPPRPDEPFRFAYWGGVARHKGVPVLLSAFQELVRRRPERPVELHVLGGIATDELERELRELARGLPVRLHGAFATAELERVSPHAGVFPSTCLETFGLVLDECFELGLPSIVADHGALPGRAGAAALRVRPGDEGDLAAAMERLLCEPATYRALRAALPAPGPTVAQHCAELERIYARARAGASTPCAARVEPHRRVAYLLRQRESALARLVPPGGPS